MMLLVTPSRPHGLINTYYLVLNKVWYICNPKAWKKY